MILTQKEFVLFQQTIVKNIGIKLTHQKLHLVQSRLLKRVLHHNLNTFYDYHKVILQNNKELKCMLNLITTNETSFFREQQHFEFLQFLLQKMQPHSQLRVWSAASSIGAEAYSIAMILDTYLELHQWEIIATDVNTKVVQKASKGLYSETLLNKIPLHYKQQYCLKGKGRFKGHFLIDRKLLNNISFKVHNLLENTKLFGEFDIIFLRNVLIYFDNDIKQKVLNNIINNLKIGGYLIISLTENLDGLNIKQLKKHQSSIYQKIG